MSCDCYVNLYTLARIEIVAATVCSCRCTCSCTCDCGGRYEMEGRSTCSVLLFRRQSVEGDEGTEKGREGPGADHGVNSTLQAAHMPSGMPTRDCMHQSVSNV